MLEIGKFKIMVPYIISTKLLQKRSTIKANIKFKPNKNIHIKDSYNY